MADPRKEEAQLPDPQPFVTFNFDIEITVTGISDRVCSAAFSECDGLEMKMEPKTIQEGGNNACQHHLVGPVTYGTLSLKRGMTTNFDLWKWFESTQNSLAGRRQRADADVIIYTSEAAQKEVAAHFLLTRCLPTKLKVPALSAKDGQIAIEEMEIAYETLKLKIE